MIMVRSRLSFARAASRQSCTITGAACPTVRSDALAEKECGLYLQ